MNAFLRAVAVAAAMLILPNTAKATANDDTTTTTGLQKSGIWFVDPGHTQYTTVSINLYSCGTAGSLRISTGHPRYQQMFQVALAAQLARAAIIIGFENIGGQCWLKRIGIETT